MIKQFLLVLILLTIPLSVPADVIFSDDFEWGSDWDSSQSSVAPTANGWDGTLIANRGGSYEACYVNAAGAKQGARGFIQYWDTIEGTGAQDIWLTTNSITFTNEYYIGFWFKVDTNWDWGSVSSLKLIKTNYADVGNTTWDIVWYSNFIAACGDSWCNIDGTNWTGDSGCDAALCPGGSAAEVFGCWSDVDDGNWHYFIFHINHSGNIMTIEIDGNDAGQMSPTGDYGTPFTDGINGSERWNFGGNITNGGGGYSEMYTAYDDLIIATTKEEVETFLGVSGSSTPTITGSHITGGHVH